MVQRYGNESGGPGRSGRSGRPVGAFLLCLVVLGGLSVRQYRQLEQLRAASQEQSQRQVQDNSQLVGQLVQLHRGIAGRIDRGIAERLPSEPATLRDGKAELLGMQDILSELSSKVERLNEQITLVQTNSSTGELSGRLVALSEQITQSKEQLSQILGHYRAAEDIVAQVSGGVCLIQGEYMFVDPQTQLPLRYVTGADQQQHDDLRDVQLGTGGEPEPAKGVDALALTPLSVQGKGKVLIVEYTGTGFLIDPRGYIITNGHVTTPWTVSAGYGHLLTAGYQGRLCMFRAIFPKQAEPIDLQVVARCASEDVALLHGEIAGKGIPALQCQPDPMQVRAGQTVIVLGYPTGFDALLARMTQKELNAIAGGGNVSFDRMAQNMAAQGLIEPTATQGICGRVSDGKIVYDAQTAIGGSGAPVLGSDGQVVAINTALLKGFAGTNFGIPVRWALELLQANVGTDVTANSAPRAPGDL